MDLKTKIINIFTVQCEVHCLWLGNGMVFSDGPVLWSQQQVPWEFWGQRSLQDGLPVEAVWRGQTHMLVWAQAKVGGMSRITSGLGSVHAPWTTLLGTLSHIHAPPEISSGFQSWWRTWKHPMARPMKEPSKWMNWVKVQMFLLFTEGLRVQNHQMRWLKMFGKSRDSSPANSGLPQLDW